jgi:hypothetical protein
MRKLIVAAAVAALALFTLPPSGMAAGENEAPPPLRPNLRPMPIDQSDIQIRYNPAKRVRRLRFTTDILNRGKGPFELGPKDDKRCEGDTDGYLAHQRVFFDLNDNEQYDVATEHTSPRQKEVGCFLYHPPHNHWHFQEFADYALYRVRDDGTLSRRAMDRADKVSFCMLDTSKVGWEIAGKPSSGQYGSGGCESTNPARIDHLVSGISVGWYDNYRQTLPGQSLDINGLDRGSYCLSIHIDPLNKLTETANGDNLRMTWIELESRESARVRPNKVCPSK